MEKRKNVVGQQILLFHMFEHVFSSKYDGRKPEIKKTSSCSLIFFDTF